MRLYTSAGVVAVMLGLCSGALAAPAAAASQSLASQPINFIAVYAAPAGTGSLCSASHPCSLIKAQHAVRRLLASGAAHHPAARGRDDQIQVTLADGTYRLRAPLRFGPADSGTAGLPVIWTAAPHAHPVLTGSVRVSAWRLADASHNVWQAPVPSGIIATQLYVDGKAAPIDQQSPQSLQLNLSSSNVATGYGISGATATFFSDLAAHMNTTELQEVRFVWNPAPPTDWEESECPIDAVTPTAVVMAQPCWNNLTHKGPTVYGGNKSNVTPFNLKSGTPPTAIDNTYVPATNANPPAPRQWYADRSTNKLYYTPLPGQNIATLDVEIPRLESLLTVTGSLADPVSDLVFRGLTFTGTTWVQPATKLGFPQVQANLDVTQPDVMDGGARRPANQGECTFATPVAGSCPWAAFSEPPAGVVLSAARRVIFHHDVFKDMGAIGIKMEYGSDDNLVQGSRFTQIASSAIWLGCSGDPNPGAVDDPATTVIADCSANPAASAHDQLGRGGADEIMRGNTVDNNLIYHVAYGYPGAAGVTLLFTRHTTISHNQIFDLPYDAITSGAWQGHVNVPRKGEPVDVYYNTSTNINAYNAIVDNVFHQVMQSYGDGGAIYSEGQQGPTRYNADSTINYPASYVSGLVIRGNVSDSDSGHKQYFYAPDVGSQWVTVTGNVGWNAPARGRAYSMSSHWPLAPSSVYTWTSGNWFANPDDTPHSPGLGTNTVIPAFPGPAELPLKVLRRAGLTAAYRGLERAVAPSIYYTAVSGTTVFVAGEGVTDKTTVRVGGIPSRLRFLSAGFALASVPPGAKGSGVSVASTPVGK